ncbi:MAG: DUF2877 domain-containing protein [Actinomycetota bacterium]|nr:DUF2877 domain-containing protein [Actinomycetota bacterium]
MRTTGVQVRERDAATSVRVAAAASTWTVARLGGVTREVAVIASGPHAVYLDVDGDAIALLARCAVQVPVGLRTGLRSLPRPGTARVGAGELRLGPLVVRPARLVDPYVPRLPGLAVRGRAWATGVPGSLPASMSATLPVPALQSLAVGDPSAVAQLIGRGEGLTPLGDDVLAAWLVSRAAAGLDHGDVGSAVLAATGRTTTLSATLLRRALAGESVPQLRDLLIAVATGVGPEQLRCQLDELLAVGHTSGAGLALGAALALPVDSP